MEPPGYYAFFLASYTTSRKVVSGHVFLIFKLSCSSVVLVLNPLPFRPLSQLVVQNNIRTVSGGFIKPPSLFPPVVRIHRTNRAQGKPPRKAKTRATLP